MGESERKRERDLLRSPLRRGNFSPPHEPREKLFFFAAFLSQFCRRSVPRQRRRRQRHDARSNKVVWFPFNQSRSKSIGRHYTYNSYKTYLLLLIPFVTVTTSA